METWKIITPKRRSIITEIIETHDKYKKCYFWQPRGNAQYRRRQEFDRSLSFSYGGREYEINQYLQISCKNYYFKTTISVDGTKKTIKALLDLI